MFTRLLILLRSASGLAARADEYGTLRLKRRDIVVGTGYDHKKAIVVYCDGHLGEVSTADVKALDQKGGASNGFWDAAGN